jgi:hypothetical protein
LQVELYSFRGYEHKVQIMGLLVHNKQILEQLTHIFTVGEGTSGEMQDARHKLPER